MTNQENKSTITHPDDMSFTSVQVFAWSCALATEAVVIVVGNLLTIVLFAFNKKLRSKKSLYLVLNMAFADLFLGGVCLPMYVHFLARLPLHGQVKLDEKTPTIFRSIFFVFAQASFVTAALISAERFYAIYWPLKHRQTLSTRAYRFVILTVWTSSILGSLSIVFLLQFLLLVSLIALGSWLPTIVYHLIAFLGYRISNNVFLMTCFAFYFNSFINPILYALRIPDFKEALSLCCFTSHEAMSSHENSKRETWRQIWQWITIIYSSLLNGKL